MSNTEIKQCSLRSGQLTAQQAQSEFSRLAAAVGRNNLSSVTDMCSFLAVFCTGIKWCEFNLSREGTTFEDVLRLLKIPAGKDSQVLVFEDDKAVNVYHLPISDVTAHIRRQPIFQTGDMIVAEKGLRWLVRINDTGGVSSARLSGEAGKLEPVKAPELSMPSPNRFPVFKTKETLVTNVSGLADSQVFSWLPYGLKNVKQAVFFPDVSPIEGKIPTGCAVHTADRNWRALATSDVGCGMQLLSTSLKWDDFSERDWDRLAKILADTRGGLGDLGGGNHFLDAVVSLTDSRIHFLVHTGSRRESFKLAKLANDPKAFDARYQQVLQWAKGNRDAIRWKIEGVFGKTNLILDSTHNSVECLPDESVIIRKGAVKVDPGGLAVIPSSPTGDIVLGHATGAVLELLGSLNHGTGRNSSRTSAREGNVQQDLESVEKAIYVPPGVSRTELQVHAPCYYRKLEDCMTLLRGALEPVEVFSPIAYMGNFK